DCASLDGATLTNNGTLVSSGASFACLDLVNGARIENAGTWTFSESPNGNTVNGDGSGVSVHNTGLVQQVGTSPSAGFFNSNAAFDNDGSVENDDPDGALTIEAGSASSTGGFTAGTGATLGPGTMSVDGT